jgi:hypothetical protein
LLFFGQSQGNNVASSSAPPLLELFIVHEPCSFNLHDYLTKKPNRSYDKAHILQDSWAVKFPWVELILGEDSMVS